MSNVFARFLYHVDAVKGNLEYHLPGHNDFLLVLVRVQHLQQIINNR